MPENASLVIRHAEPEDAEALHQLYKLPRVIWGTLQMPYPSLKMWRERLADPPPNFTNLVATAEGVIVGQLGLRVFSERARRRHVATLGMAVRDDWHGRGVGSALMEAALDLADNWLNVRRVELEVYTDNTPAVHLYEKYGFVVEGRQRDFAFRDGVYVDAFTMARFHPDLGPQDR